MNNGVNGENGQHVIKIVKEVEQGSAYILNKKMVVKIVTGRTQKKNKQVGKKVNTAINVNFKLRDFGGWKGIKL